MPHSFRRALAALLAAALCLGSPATWAQQDPAIAHARVLSHTSLPPPRGGYSVVYEHAGRQYTTWLAQPPGPTLQVQIGVLAQVPPPPPSAPPAAPPMRSLLEPITITVAAIALGLGLVLGGGWLRPGPPGQPGR